MPFLPKIRTILFTLIFFSANPLQAQSPTHETQIQYLSGTGKDHRVDWDFMIDKGRRSGAWSKIAVPSNWELEGFGVFNYGHAWRDSLPNSDATGFYKHKFTVYNAWKGKTVALVFDGVMTDAVVRVNGKQAGPIHQGSFYQFKYDITKLLKFGKENLLEVMVKNVSANQSVNKAERDADFWVFGGIYRPVYLEVKPVESIDRMAIDARADGHFAVDVFLKNIKKAKEVSAQILSMENVPVGAAFQVNIAKGDEKVRLNTLVNNPRLWSSEFPNRYQLVLTLKDEAGAIHEMREIFGFRTVELREKDGFYVNGQKIIFKGVNRHSHWPTSGRTESKELAIMDVNLMKDMNMNAVRMSHYPPDKRFLDVCDSLGLYVIDELTGWQDAYDTLVGRKLVKELIVRDVNHPSIIIWANGNEGGNNHALLQDYPLYDLQNRVVIHPWNTLGKTNTFHYPDLDYVMDVLSKKDKVYFPTEMMHGLYDGGHGAGLEDFWQVMQNSQLSAGGFLWVLADEGIVRNDRGGAIDVSGTSAPDGIVGPYREKEASFYTIKEIWSPVYINQQHITPQFNGKLKLENRFAFTNLNQCSFEWRLVNYPSPASGATDSVIMQKAKISAPAIEPGLTGYLPLNLPENWANADALYVTANDPNGRHIHTWTWPLKTAAQIAATIVKTPANNQVAEFAEDANYLTLSANGVKVKINKLNGLIDGVNNAKTSLSFGGGPKMIAGKSTFKSVQHHQEGNSIVVDVKYEGPISEMRYTMMGNGWLKLDYTYNLYGDVDFAGISFTYPEEKVKGVRWLGNGPFRVWKNRMKGPHFAVHQKKYNNTVTGQDWNYPEFKGYHDRMFWAVIDNEEYPFTIVSETDHLFLRLFTPKPSGHAKVDPLFPEGDISFMDGITPIGTKFQKAELLGPQGNKNQFRNRKETERMLGGTLYFDFGAGVLAK